MSRTAPRTLERHRWPGLLLALLLALTAAPASAALAEDDVAPTADEEPAEDATEDDDGDDDDGQEQDEEKVGPRRRDVADTCTVTAKGFKDVGKRSLFAGSIACVRGLGLASGVGGNQYRPRGHVSVVQMALFTDRALDLVASRQDPAPEEDDSSDEPVDDTSDEPTDAPTEDDTDTPVEDGTDTPVEDDGTAEQGCELGPLVDAAMDRALAIGAIDAAACDDPHAPLTRAGMARFMTAALDAADVEVPATTTDWFDDDDGTPTEADHDVLAELGITVGAGNRRYRPDAPVTRGQMSVFLAGLVDAALAG